MRTIGTLITISLLGICLMQAKSQGLYNEVMSFSQAPLSGSARIQGLGFAQVALGGDLSSAFSNPAGLGFFNQSEISFTPAINVYSTNSYLQLTPTSRTPSVSDSRGVLNFGNLGAAFHRSKEDEVMKGGTFAVAITKTKDFNNRITYQRSTADIDQDFFDFVFAKYDAGNEDSYTDLAYNAYLVDLFIDQINGPDTTYIYDYIASDIEPLVYPDKQTETILTKGSEYSVNLSYGANFGDKLYLGGSIGLLTLDYQERRTYSEVRSGASLQDFTLKENVDVTGAGINATLGIMFRPIDMVIIGAALTTPSFYMFDDLYDASLTSNFNSYYYAPENRQLTTEQALSDIYSSSYQLRTPLKFNTGTTVFIGKHGFITGEVEFLDYSTNHLSSNDFQTVDDNQIMDNYFTSVVNYKLGAEFRRGIFRLRGGFSHQSDPSKINDVNAEVNSITFGGGIRLPKFFIDLGIVTSSYNSKVRPFASSMYNTVENKRVSALVTTGFNF